MKYQSSRGQWSQINSAEAIIMGISPDGGLFVPDYIPQLSSELLAKLEPCTYQDRALEIMQLFLTDFSADEINHCINRAYNSSRFDDSHIVPLVKIDNNTFAIELWHGPTSAFKDIALQILPWLVTASMRKTGEDSQIAILVATSGDTGKAALEGFKDVEGTRIIVFFPDDGVSQVQKQQMIAQEGNNVYVAAVRGNFDDAQSGVKRIFTNNDLAKVLLAEKIKLSSANSINWGRLLPQTVYYVSSYVDMVAGGHINSNEAINIVVPTGNFGNILAAFYAKEMGIPVNKLICASNRNNVLTDFINTGIYDRNRRFERTISPSMDILISSNLERLLYEMSGHNPALIVEWMDKLNNIGKYEVSAEVREKIQAYFWAGFSDDNDTIETISKVWKNHHYLLDTHTAVAFNVYEQYRTTTGDNTKTVIASTASPFKFGGSVASALLPQEVIQGKDDFELINVLSEFTGQPIPRNLRNLDQKPVRFSSIITQEEMLSTVKQYLLGENR
ncbi:MAG: threonine synthase [Syntrophomonadaceae bacterium]